MEVIVSFFRLVYHDASSIGLELEVADAVKSYVLHHLGQDTHHPGHRQEGLQTFRRRQNRDNGQWTMGNEIYNLSGLRIGKVQRGINIVRTSDGTTKKILVK